MYRQVAAVIRELKGQPALRGLLGPLTDQENSIHYLLEQLEHQANIMLTRIGTDMTGRGGGGLQCDFGLICLVEKM